MVDGKGPNAAGDGAASDAAVERISSGVPVDSAASGLSVDGAASGAATGEAVPEPAVGSTAEALAATMRWASPLQWGSLLVSGGVVAFAVVSGRWQAYDWLFVFLFVVYLANAIGFRRLLRRVP